MPKTIVVAIALYIAPSCTPGFAHCLPCDSCSPPPNLLQRFCSAPQQLHRPLHHLSLQGRKLRRIVLFKLTVSSPQSNAGNTTLSRSCSCAKGAVFCLACGLTSLHTLHAAFFRRAVAVRAAAAPGAAVCDPKTDMLSTLGTASGYRRFLSGRAGAAYNLLGGVRWGR